tara:strand:+ start:316 stop:687 length:372 start_codon:yes stop_codon:yes gene_type:complete
MKRFYSLFVTDDKLLSSPYIRRFNFLNDLTLNLGQSEKIRFLLQAPITAKQKEQLDLHYDPATLLVEDVEIQRFPHQTLVTLNITPKELGTVSIGLSYPDIRPARSEKALLGRHILRRSRLAS